MRNDEHTFRTAIRICCAPWSIVVCTTYRAWDAAPILLHMPQQLQARREHFRKARVSLEQQMERLTDAYLTVPMLIDGQHPLLIGSRRGILMHAAVRWARASPPDSGETPHDACLPQELISETV